MLQDQYPTANNVIIYQQPVDEKLPAEPVGAAITCYTSPLTIHLVDIKILPTYQGRQIGTTFLRSLQAKAQEQGESITLSVATDNVGACKLYTRLGFHTVCDPAKEDKSLMYQEMIWTSS